jgi:hypothetical protein
MKSKMIAIVLVLSLSFAWIPSFASTTASGVSAQKGYTDIKGNWAEQAIASYADFSVFADADGRFFPAKPITRSEFVLMMHKSLGISIQYLVATDIKQFYSDVANGDPYATALYDLANTGIIDYRGTFRPNESLPRDEMVHFIMNALKYELGGNLPVNNRMPILFSDDSKITEAYKSDVYRALLLGLVHGRGNGVFDPVNGTSRAEAAAMASRLVDAVKTLKP